MKSLEKYSKSTVSRLKALLIEYGDSEDADVLHDIRVEIKKLKAVLLVLEDCIKKFKAHKHYIPFRRIFRQAGAIREPQVAGQLATQYHLGKRIGKEQAPTGALIKIFKFDIPVLVRRVNKSGKEIVHDAAQVRKKDFSKSVRRKARLVKKNMHPVVPSELHRTRKILKEILYLSDVTHVVSKKERVFYAALEHRIGELHDKQNLMKSIRGEKPGKMNAAMVKDETAIGELVRKFYRKRKK